MCASAPHFAAENGRFNRPNNAPTRVVGALWHPPSCPHSPPRLNICVGGPGGPRREARPRTVAPTLAAAPAAFLDRDYATATRPSYAGSVGKLLDGLGATLPLDSLGAADVAAWFRYRHGAAAPATWNRELATLRSAGAWWRARARRSR